MSKWRLLRRLSCTINFLACWLFLTCPIPSLASQVGNLGAPSSFEFSGNNNFSDTSIIAGLTFSTDFLAASHPLAPLDDYLSILKECIVRGYHNFGYPDVEVWVTLDESKKIVRIKIDEGSRYKKGEIRVIGNKIVPTEAITEKLTQPSLPPKASEFEVAGARIAGSGDFSIKSAQRTLTQPKLRFIDQKEMVDIKLIDSIEDALRLVPIEQSKEERKAKEEENAQDTSSLQQLEDSASNDNLTYFDLSAFEGPNPCPPWNYSKDFVSLYRGNLPSIEQSVKNLFAHYGFPLAKVKADFDIDSSSYTAHLRLHVEEGPPATIRKIKVVGNKITTDGEILQWTGLHPGLRLTPSLIQSGKIALWNSARFANFKVDVKVIDQIGQDYEIEIDVLESRHLPENMTSVEPTMERSISALASLANWFTTEALTEGITIRVDIPGAPKWTVIASNEKGLALFVGESLETSKLAISVQKSSFRFYARDGEKISIYNGELSVGSLAVTFYVFADQFSLFTGASTRANSCDFDEENKGVVKIANIVSPEVLISSFNFLEEFKPEFKAGEVSFKAPANDSEIIRFNEKTGRLSSFDSTNIETSDIIPDDVIIKVEAGASDIEVISNFIDQFNEVNSPSTLKYVSYADIAGESYLKDLLGDSIDYSEQIKLEGFLADLPIYLKIFEQSFPVIKDLLVDLFHQQERFLSIPRSQNTRWQPSIMGGFFGPMIFRFANMLGPPDTWLSLLAHEYYYILNGHKRFTQEVMQQLFNDPQMGPLGSMMTAYMLKNMHPMFAWRFAARAKEYNSLENFRADCQLFLDEETEIGQYIQELLLKFSDSDDDFISKLLVKLNKTEADLVSNLLKSIQQNKDQNINLLAQSHLDKWWVKSISPNLANRVRAMIGGGTEVNSDEYTSVVNGIPISRNLLSKKNSKPHFFVKIPERLLRNLEPSKIPLESLIIQTLVLQDGMNRGYDLSDEKIEEFIEDDINRQPGADREQYEQVIADEGFSYSEYRDLFRMNTMFNEMQRVIMTSTQMPLEDEIKVAVKEHIAENELRHIQAISLSDDGQGIVDNIVAATKGKSGFPAVYKELTLNNIGGVEVFDFIAIKKSDLNKDLAGPAFDLEAGEVSNVVNSGSTLFILYNVGPDSEEMQNLLGKKLIESRSKSSRQESFIAYLTNLRSNAFVVNLEKTENSLEQQFAYANDLYKIGDFQGAIEICSSLADQENADAQYLLGKIYEEGSGVAQDYDEALLWFTEAARQSHALAQFSLGRIYYEGKGVEKDYSMAANFFKLAGSKNHVAALSCLGQMYYSGEGVSQDYWEALKWFGKAGNKGDAYSQYYLGKLFRDGRVNSLESKKVAAEWFTKAADQGYAEAQYELGHMFVQGEGVQQDYDSAYKWLSNAAEQGIEKAQHLADSICRKEPEVCE